MNFPFIRMGAKNLLDNTVIYSVFSFFIRF